MACQTCKRTAQAGSCEDGYVHYLSGDYPCPFNPDPLATVKNYVELPPLVVKRVAPPSPAPSTDGLEDLL